MLESFDHSIFAAAIVVQVLGLASVLFTRLSERSWAQNLCQRFFLACLVLVGAATVLTLFSGTGYWAWCGTTLAVMAVGATIDFGRNGREALV